MLEQQYRYSGKLGMTYERYNNVDTLERKSVERRMVVVDVGAGTEYIQLMRKGWFYCLLFLWPCSLRNPFLGARLPNDVPVT